jgi:tetratricopeptide (TPR) repeat protein
MRRGIYIARRILEEIRRNGVSHLWRLALSRLKRTLGPKASIDTIPKHKIELIDEIRNVRTMEVCANVLEDLQTKMVSDQFKSAPLALLRNLLSEMKLDVKKSDKVERSLIKLTQSDPEWADPWLELGFLREDQGRSEDALLCFSRAMKGKKAGGGSSLDPHPAVMAAVHRGRALAKAGNDEGARQCFEAALSQDPAQRLAAIELANVLRRLGHINEALMFYSDGMYYQETRWSLPVPPRSLETLRLPHLTGRMTAILEPGFFPAIS